MSSPPLQVLLPKLTDRMAQGKVLRWLVREGAAVRRGDFVAEVQTDKAAMQVESTLDGRVRRFLVQLGQDVSVGAALIELEPLAGPEPAPAPPAAGVEPRPARSLPNPTGDITDDDELSVLDQEDLLRTSEQTRAWREIPQAVVNCRIEVDKTVAMVADYNRGFRQLDRKLYAERVVLAAAVRALEKYPQMNARFDGQRVLKKKKINLGLVVDSGGSEIVAVLADVARMTAPELLGNLRSLEAMAKSGMLTAEQRSYETIVAQVLPYESIGRFWAPVIPPTVARLGVGGVRADKTQIITLAIDCRVTTVSAASDYLRAIRRLMSNPLALMFPPE